MKIYNRLIIKIKTFIKPPVEIPSYETKRKTIKKYKDEYNINILVETGTFMGDTVDYFKNIFSKVISVELAEDLAIEAQNRFSSNNNVRIIQGDSAKVLKRIVNNSKESILFWLDGHYSSEFFMNGKYIKTAKADFNTPIKEELKTILVNKFKHVILIDDARLFNGANDYPKIRYIKNLVKKLNKGYTVSVENDIIRITEKMEK